MKLYTIYADSNKLKEEQLKGARLSVYFRWFFILLITSLLLIQAMLGHQAESSKSIVFILIYIVSNFGLWFAVKRKYNPRYLGFFSAFIDVGIVCMHLYVQTVNFDYTSSTAAATTFLIPILFLLYTFRLDKGLMYFLIFISVIGFNLVYLTNYFESPELYNLHLSLSPTSHFFKSAYIIFIGLLCVYFQYSISRFINTQISEATEKAKLDARIRVEQEKNMLTQQHLSQEKILIRNLEKEVKEKEQIASKLNESQETLQSIMSNLVGAASRCKFDKNLTVKYYSDKIEEITGYPASDFTDNRVRSFASIIHPDDFIKCNKKIEEAVSTKEPYEFEYRIFHKTGKVVWLKENGKVIFNEKGEIEWLDGISIDITEQKEAEAAYHEVETRFKELTDLLPQPVYELDNEGNIVFCNKATTDLFGDLKTNDKGKKSALQVFVPEDIERVKENLTLRLNGTKLIQQNQYRAYNQKGEIVDVIIYGAPIYRNNEIVGTRGIIIDVTHMKSVEKELKKAKTELELLNKHLEQTVEERTRELTEVNTQLLKLQKENLQSQFEVLKQQVNPHFLFNSLNVLTSLIKVDPDLAETFTERLSKVYRYVLENKDKDLVTLSTEMDFLRAYVFLIDIRFKGKVFVNINFNEDEIEGFVVPLALQLLIENAIKHNTFSKKNPLNINMFVDNNNFLNIVNNLQNRETHMVSTGVGLVNISKRYSLLTESEPVFELTKDEFIAKIPLIKKENKTN
jgi:PAS domain S-box-containing protein